MRAEYKRDIIKELDMLLETGPVSKIYMTKEELYLYKKAAYPEPDRYALSNGKIVPFYMHELIELYGVEFYHKDVLIGLEKDK